MPGPTHGAFEGQARSRGRLVEERGHQIPRRPEPDATAVFQLNLSVVSQ
jgi:hypothetical protein